MALKNTSSNLSFNASSIIGDASIANFSANSYTSNQVDFSINVSDLTKYVANKEEVDADLLEFMSSVVEKVNVSE